jgi:hypothetical protein
VKAAQENDQTAPAAGATHSQVKPRPRLFAALCVLFVIWIGVLVTLYVLTVYPRRHSALPPAPQPAGQTP